MKINNIYKTVFLKLDLFAEHKSTGSSNNGRDSRSKRLGIKINNQEYVKQGQIIVTQRGTKFKPGKNTFLSKNHTIHSYINGIVSFKVRKYIGRNRFIKLVHVIPIKKNEE